MIRYHGKTVWTRLDELVNPAHTALIVVDVQNDFCAPEGLFAKSGVDISMYPSMTERISGLTASARAAGVPVIYLLMTQDADHVTDSPAQIRFNMRLHQGLRPDAGPLEYTLLGTWGHEIIEELTPEPADIVVKKYRSSGFWGTNLDQLLRSLGRQTVVMAGLTTEGCVESTARDALFADYYVVIAEDGVASDDPAQHEASLLLMCHRFDMASCRDLMNIWEAGQRG